MPTCGIKLHGVGAPDFDQSPPEIVMKLFIPIKCVCGSSSPLPAIGPPKTGTVRPIQPHPSPINEVLWGFGVSQHPENQLLKLGLWGSERLALLPIRIRTACDRVMVLLPVDSDQGLQAPKLWTDGPVTDEAGFATSPYSPSSEAKPWSGTGLRISSSPPSTPSYTDQLITQSSSHTAS